MVLFSAFAWKIKKKFLTFTPVYFVSKQKTLQCKKRCMITVQRFWITLLVSIKALLQTSYALVVTQHQCIHLHIQETHGSRNRENSFHCDLKSPRFKSIQHALDHRCECRHAVGDQQNSSSGAHEATRSFFYLCSNSYPLWIPLSALHRWLIRFRVCLFHFIFQRTPAQGCCIFGWG